jgi:hypothetical protein
VTGGEVAAAVLQKNAIAAMMSVVARVIAPRLYHFVVALCRAKEAQSARVKYWEIIGNNLSEAGWTWDCVATVDREGRAIWVVVAERNAQRFIVHSDEKLTAFIELESASWHDASKLTCL